MRYLLFTTTRCFKCPDFKTFVAEHVGFSGETLDEKHPHFTQLIADNGVQSAPTIIVFTEQQGESKAQEIFRTSELNDLQRFLQQHPC